MKKTKLLLVGSLMVLTNYSLCQDNFFFCLGADKIWNAPGVDISKKKPALKFEVGYRPEIARFLTFSVSMRPLSTYSPGLLKDSTKVIVPAIDSLHPQWSYMKITYARCATLLGNIGLLAGNTEGGFMGGMNTGAGVAFIEKKNRLITSPVWNYTLEGGYCFKKVRILLSCTYSYLIDQPGGSIKNQAFGVYGGLSLGYFFGGE